MIKKIALLVLVALVGMTQANSEASSKDPNICRFNLTYVQKEMKPYLDEITEGLGQKGYTLDPGSSVLAMLTLTDHFVCQKIANLEFVEDDNESDFSLNITGKTAKFCVWSYADDGEMIAEARVRNENTETAIRRMLNKLPNCS